MVSESLPAPPSTVIRGMPVGCDSGESIIAAAVSQFRSPAVSENCHHRYVKIIRIEIGNLYIIQDQCLPAPPIPARLICTSVTTFIIPASRVA
jgi:hypothetical protein